MCQIYIVAVTNLPFNMVEGLFTSGNSQIERTIVLINIINNMCSVILFFRVLCNFVFPGVLSFSWPVRHFYFPLVKKKRQKIISAKCSPKVNLWRCEKEQKNRP